MTNDNNEEDFQIEDKRLDPNEAYLGNPLLKKANIQIEYTAEQVEEIAKCYEDPLYFAEHYVQIVTLDKGLQPFKMYPFQKNMVERFHNNRFNICKLPRQSGKSTTVCAYLLHLSLIHI